MLIPGWIIGCGGVILVAPPMGVGASMVLFLVAVLVIPAIAFIPRSGDGYAPRAS